MIKAEWCSYKLVFNFLAKTSREEMRTKETYFVRIFDTDQPEIFGLGECALFKGLSADDVPEFENRLDEACRQPLESLPQMSAIRFGLETALADFQNGGKRIILDNDWISGLHPIAINGLIWMGDKAEMVRRVEEKITKGFKILKLKIGGINFDEEISILKSIRERFDHKQLEIRLDANGSFTPVNALDRLDKLSKFDIHSIEQPIAAGQREAMRRICIESPIAIALDEELIGFNSTEAKREILSEIRPQYIILKPSLCGGLRQSDEWIDLAHEFNVGWWATSALESNIGLNAIAQWVSTKNNHLAQGLGTGELYTNNIPSPLTMEGCRLNYRPDKKWIIPDLIWQD